MNKKNFLKNIFQVAISNGFRLVSSILIGIILPIIFDLENYGYYRLFTLYFSYIGLFHFGFIDGIYLHYGGKNYEDLDRNKFRAFTRFLLYLETLAGLIIIVISLLFLSGDRKVVFIFLGINTIAINLFTYFQFISQITSRFKEFSKRNIVYSFLSIISVSIIFIFKLDNYKILLTFLVLINYILMIWYSLIYRDIVYGKTDGIIKHKNAIIKLFKLGLPLLIANLITVFMLNFAKQVVDWNYSIETFAIFSFAYSMMSFANVFITAISTVVYPTLKKIDSGRLKDYYVDAIALITIIVFFALLLYYPLNIFVNNVVPKYSTSLGILKYIFPGLVVTSSIQIVKLNYFKSLQKIKVYLLTGIVSLFLSVILNLGAYYLFHTLQAIAISSVISFLMWYILTDIFFIKKYKISPYKIFIFLVLNIMIFYIFTSFNNIYLGFILNFIFLTIITILFYKQLILKFIIKKDIIKNEDISR